MSELILHHYDASPFTQRALLMLGIKGLRWRSVTTPMMPPKDDLVTLTGGYRGTPVLQVGADVYIDSQRIARELERRHPQPTLFPGGGGGMTFAAVKWADAFFRAGLHVAIGTTAAAWPAEFRADRQGLFPDIDFAGIDLAHARAQLQAHAACVEEQLADGRRFLAGDAPGLLDIHAWTVPWFTRNLPGVAELYAAMPQMQAWDVRVQAIGSGERIEDTAEAAFAAARAARPEPCTVSGDEKFGLRAGQAVEVVPDDTRRCAVRGKL
ncbi:MAG: glutathione S-transferase family protein, partial [Steroidobacteraceae bacterium]